VTKTKIDLGKKKKSLKLRKGIIIVVVDKFKYLVEDVFDSEIIDMRLSGKLNFPNLNVGDEVYVAVSPFDLNRGRMVTSSLFKMDHKLFGQKLDLDKKEKKKKQVNKKRSIPFRG